MILFPMLIVVLSVAMVIHSVQRDNSVLSAIWGWSLGINLMSVLFQLKNTGLIG